ncbi:hypothetical protein [Streptomyces rubrogriseus]|uniref:hypothetical protein n=1 Tax=Streptomyces rubrogriseus TaxID=194673 RepID=UPI00364B7A66
MPGVFPHTASRSTPGPRQDGTEGTLRFADLSRLATTPEAVESALSTYAGAAWTPSPVITVPQMPAQQAEQVFSAKRSLLVAVAVPCTAILGWQLVSALFIRPSETSVALLPLVIWALSFTGAWFSVSRLVRPVKLVVGAAGLTLTRGQVEIAYAWTEIERIGVVNWPRGARPFGLLAIRPSGSTQGRVDRTSMLLPRLAPKCLTLCLLPEVTHNQLHLEAALAHFADEHQLALPAEAWLRVKAGMPKPPVEGVTLRGRQPAKVSTMIVLALITLSMASAQLQSRVDWVPNDLLVEPFVFVGIPAYFITGMHQVSFHIGPTGVTIGAFGRQRLHIPWGDLDRAGVVSLSDPVEHALVLWSRPGAAIPRSVLLPFRRRYGGLRILTLQNYRVNASPQHVDEALARYAGRRHTQMAVLR